jgi:hypothetical protein
MVLFYLTCGIVLVTASYGGVYFTFGHINEGIENNDKAELTAGINFHQLEGAIITQLPENLAPIKVDAGPYANSAVVVNNAPKIKVNADTFVGLLKKSGICAPAGASEGYDPDACTTTMESMAYSRLIYRTVNNADKNLWVRYIIGKDQSIIVWRLLSATLSKQAMDKVLN